MADVAQKARMRLMRSVFNEAVRQDKSLIGMLFLFCSQDEVSNDPRRLRAASVSG
ncbi:hypothetical protein X777_08732 [Ooceraea biroi]|uniref:Uncharacterized protein n=1 Tax=Ooceraea biroi TaxID=2015173 RepID=A0A026WB16_OOCBI|nr:hypothetical protein X777_08732 [Ooceraea biroi]